VKVHADMMSGNPTADLPALTRLRLEAPKGASVQGGGTGLWNQVAHYMALA
jgi:hypothetical protein